jgi:hypothetical protein
MDRAGSMDEYDKLHYRMCINSSGIGFFFPKLLEDYVVVYARMASK